LFATTTVDASDVHAASAAWTLAGEAVEEADRVVAAVPGEVALVVAAGEVESGDAGTKREVRPVSRGPG